MVVMLLLKKMKMALILDFAEKEKYQEKTFLNGLMIQHHKRLNKINLKKKKAKTITQVIEDFVNYF